MNRLYLKVRGSLAAFAETLEQCGPLNLVTQLTTLVLLCFHDDYWYVTGPITSLGAAGLIWPQFRRTAGYWMAASVVLGISAIKNWYAIDNHQYLLVYWCVALFLSHLCRDAGLIQQIVRRNGAMLLGLVMALATTQKLLSKTYLDGSFFEYMLLREPRFESISWILGGVPIEDLRINQVLEWRLLDTSAGAQSLEEVTFHGSDRLRCMAVFLTWATVGIEGLIALLFLLPRPNAVIHMLRVWALAAFIFAGYWVAPVVGFGWILIILGLAQMPAAFRKSKLCFVCFFLLLPVFKVPLARVVIVLKRMVG